MKISLNEVRQIVRSILTESVCPICGDKDAYMGLNSIECPNKNCPKFSQKQYDNVHPPVPQESESPLAIVANKIMDYLTSQGLQVDEDGTDHDGYFIVVVAPPYDTPEYMEPFWDQLKDAITSAGGIKSVYDSWKVGDLDIELHRDGIKGRSHNPVILIV